MRAGILTGGGDCPGLNAVIRAVDAAAARPRLGGGRRPRGLARARRGQARAARAAARSRGSCRAAGRSSARRGRTRTSSTAASRRCSRTFEENALDALVAIGGEDTLGVAARLHEEHEFPVVGVPKTIDNDLSGTDYTFGFDTAVFVCTEAIDRLHTTAESHNRVMVVEVMGRHTGWIAVMSGIAGGADVILIPEHPITVEDALRGDQPPPRARQGLLDRRRQRGVRADVRVRREAAGRAGGRARTSSATSGSAASAPRSRAEIEERTGYETRVTVLGHVQRGGTPTPRDRVLATRYGLKAADLVLEGTWGRMAALPRRRRSSTSR